MEKALKPILDTYYEKLFQFLEKQCEVFRDNVIEKDILGIESTYNLNIREFQDNYNALDDQQKLYVIKKIASDLSELRNDLLNENANIRKHMETLENEMDKINESI